MRNIKKSFVDFLCCGLNFSKPIYPPQLLQPPFLPFLVFFLDGGGGGGWSQVQRSAIEVWDSFYIFLVPWEDIRCSHWKRVSKTIPEIPLKCNSSGVTL
jgi:hypothetical protein